VAGKAFISHHEKTGPIDNREYTTFLTMWLEKFIFYEKTIGPTTKMQAIAESLSTRHLIPLGIHLLGSAYSLMHQVCVKISTRQPIGNLDGP
jgi:hypothetical protein